MTCSDENHVTESKSSRGEPEVMSGRDILQFPVDAT